MLSKLGRKHKPGCLRTIAQYTVPPDAIVGEEGARGLFIAGDVSRDSQHGYYSRVIVPNLPPLHLFNTNSPLDLDPASGPTMVGER